MERGFVQIGMFATATGNVARPDLSRREERRDNGSEPEVAPLHRT